MYEELIEACVNAQYEIHNYRHEHAMNGAASRLERRHLYNIEMMYGLLIDEYSDLEIHRSNRDKYHTEARIDAMWTTLNRMFFKDRRA